MSWLLGPRLRLSLWAAVIMLIVMSLAAPARGQTRPAEWAIDFARAAASLSAAPDDLGAITIAIVPVTTTNRTLASAADDATRQLARALQAAPHYGPTRVEVIDASLTGRSTLSGVTTGPPIDIEEAVKAGQRASAGYVVTGTVIPSPQQFPLRVDVQMIDVTSGRVIQRDSASVIFAEAPNTTRPAPFWATRNFGFVAGLGATAVASYFAWRANRDLDVTNVALQEVEAGDLMTWTRLHDKASGFEKERNFWWGVSIGLAGVTTSLMVLSGSPDVAPIGQPGGPLGPVRGRWTVALNPASPRVLVKTRF